MTVVSARDGVAWTRAHWVHRIGREPSAEELAPGTRVLFEMAGEVRAGDYLLAVERLQRVARGVAIWHSSHDLWLTPTTGGIAPEVGHDAGTQDDPLAGFFRPGWPSPPITVTNVCGTPGMSLPAGLSSEGTPIGIHLAAPYAREDLLFRVAGQWERARPWSESMPTLTTSDAL